MIYLVILILLMAFSSYEHRYDITYWIMLILLAVIAGGRGIDVGVDTHTYEEIYQDISDNGYLPYLEPGWNALNIISNWVGLSFNGLLLMAALIMLIPIFYLSKKVCNNPFIPIFIYFALHIYDASFNAMRQYVSLSYVLLAYYHVSDGSWIKTILCLLFAVSMHVSNLLVVPVLVILRRISMPKNETIGLLLVIAFILGSIASDSFFSLFSMKYSSYIDNDYLYRDSSFLAAIFSVMVSGYSFFLFTLLPINKRNTIWCKVYIISLFILLLTYRLEYGARIYVMFSISQLFFIPYLLQSQHKVNPLALKRIVYCYYTIIYMRMFLHNANEIMPYSNVWL